MSNILAPPPDKKNAIVRRGIQSLIPNAAWDAIKAVGRAIKKEPLYIAKLVGGIAVVGAAAEAAINRLLGMPSDLLGILIITLVWFLLLSITFIFGRLKGRKSASALMDVVQPKAEIAKTEAESAVKSENLTKRVGLLENENTALEEARADCVEKLEATRRGATHWRERAEMMEFNLNNRIDELEKLKWLCELAERDKQDIQFHVLVMNGSVDLSYLSNIEPYVVFVFTLFNASFYDISFDSRVDGYVKFNNQKLGLNKELSCNLKVFSHGSKSHITVNQNVSEGAATTIKKAAEGGKGIFNLDKLIIKFSGKEIEPTTLMLPEGIYTTGMLYP
jgi:hypothetical protein